MDPQSGDPYSDSCSHICDYTTASFPGDIAKSMTMILWQLCCFLGTLLFLDSIGSRALPRFYWLRFLLAHIWALHRYGLAKRAVQHHPISDGRHPLGLFFPNQYDIRFFHIGFLSFSERHILPHIWRLSLDSVSVSVSDLFGFHFIFARLTPIESSLLFGWLKRSLAISLAHYGELSLSLSLRWRTDVRSFMFHIIIIFSFSMTPRQPYYY